MSPHSLARIFRRFAIIVSATVAVTGCLPTGEADQADDNGNNGGEIASDHRISGSVGDGPVTNAEIRVLGGDGTSLGAVISDATADFDVQVRTVASDYPLTLIGIGGTDLVTLTSPDFELKSMVRGTATASVANLNPFTTVAFEIATDMNGGTSPANMDSALSIVHRELNSGLSTLAGSATMEAAIDGSNVAEMIRASETLGEAIRRTRDALVASGRSSSGNSVIASIGSDLIDGVIDGRGGSRADNRIAAVFAAALAQVTLESGRNQLRVFGSDAMARIEDAMGQVFAGTPSPTLSGLMLTTEMIESMRVGLLALEVVQPVQAIATLRAEIAALTPGMNGAQVRAALSGSAQAEIDAGLIDIAAASAAELDVINAVLRNGTAPGQNSAPVIGGQPAIRVAAGAPYSFQPTASDKDGDALSFSASGLPSWASFDNSTGRLSGTPGQGDTGSNPGISISVTDGQATSSLPAFTITVLATVTNAAPTISGIPATSVVAGNNYSFTPTAADADGDALTFSISNAPSWASFSTETGSLSGTPSNGDVGTYAGIRISVSDGVASASLAGFSITVDDVNVPNRAPQISGSPGTSVQAESAYLFKPSASDPDGDTLSFSISRRPSWASFNNSTGALSGTPTDGDAGSYTGISISVSDGEFSASLPTFTIVVEPAPVNGVPVISGNPSSLVVVGSAYSFRPGASDADGDSLSFSISGKPSWAAFNSSNGRLSGTPSAGDVGTYSGIRITVSDGEDSATLGPFAITVDAITLGSATLSWTPPTQNTDGSALTDLAGYRIYWGTSSGNYDNSVTINNPGVTTYLVENLAPGTYEFVSTALNSGGVESDYSNPATKTVP